MRRAGVRVSLRGRPRTLCDDPFGHTNNIPEVP